MMTRRETTPDKEPEMTYPATHVRVETARYEAAHGRKPRGTGNWAFEVDGELWWAGAGRTYTEAKKAAQREAGGRGVTYVNVAT